MKTKQNMLSMIGTIAFLAAVAWSGVAHAQSYWTMLATPSQMNPGVTLLLTDGTVLVQQIGTSNWWKLTPDEFANYSDGSLTQVATVPMTYDPWGFASAVLPDGRVIVEGGEYNYGTKDYSNLGAIYDPTAGPLGTWTPVNPPVDPVNGPWAEIGDASSVVLPSGTFMLANSCHDPTCPGVAVSPAEGALFDATNLSWQVLTNLSGFVGKFDENAEEGWTLLPNGDVLTVDMYTGVPKNPSGMSYEIYDPITGVWTSAGNTSVQLRDAPGHETGPAVLRPDGTVFATGANKSSAGHTAIYDTTTGSWTPGPDILGVNDAADVPAALLPDGNVLVVTGPGVNTGPSTFYEFAFNGTGWISIPQPTGLLTANIESGRMLVLPSGDILYTQAGLNAGVPLMWFYTPAGTYQPAWQPVIDACCYPKSVSVGGTYTVSGIQFNGLSQGAYYGDDSQSATNYPLVLITNKKTGHKFFARTHNFSTMAVATGNLPVSTQFDVLSGTETGKSTMVVIANGIPSAAVNITVKKRGE